jgi:hypothetical protein
VTRDFIDREKQRVVGRSETSVTPVPEPLSPRNRSRVPKLSGAYRSHRVQHEPVSHSRCRPIR